MLTLTISRLINDLSKKLVPSISPSKSLPFLFFASMLSIGAFIWGCLCLYFNLRFAALIPFGYIILWLVNLLLLNKRLFIHGVVFVQGLASISLPFIFQAILGGGIYTGMVILWSLLTVVACLTFYEGRYVFGWLAIFLIFTVLTIHLNDFFAQFAPAQLKNKNIQEGLFLFNFSMVGIIFFFLANYFINQQRQAIYAMKKMNQTLHKQKIDLEKAQEELVEKEKMASLGGLISGIAHEINTPLGVINGSIVNLENVVSFVVNDLPSTYKNLSKDIENIFFSMIEHIVKGVNSKKILSTREERICRKKIDAQLKEYGIENTRLLAQELVRVGLISDLEKYRQIFEDQNRDEMLKAVIQLGKIGTNTNNTKSAVSKMQKIVFALKNYAYHSNQEDMMRCNVVQGLETVLTLYYNQMKKGIVLERNFSDSEGSIIVMGLPDQLDQVWTNIIQNAIHAMDYQGNLKINIFKKAEKAVVEIIDSGSGIAQDLQEKIFEPFFTTKKQGMGSGLGLGICRKIIKKHNGEIRIESKPGHTCFRVVLPLAAASEKIMQMAGTRM